MQRDVLSWDLEPVSLNENVIGFSPQIDPKSTRSWMTFPQYSNSDVVSEEEKAVLGADCCKTICEHKFNKTNAYEFTEYVLHWHTLAVALHRLCYAVPHRPNKILFYLGACYSASMFPYLALQSPTDISWQGFDEQKRTELKEQLAQILVKQKVCEGTAAAKQQIEEMKLCVITSSNRIFAISTWCWNAYLKLLEDNNSFRAMAE